MQRMAVSNTFLAGMECYSLMNKSQRRDLLETGGTSISVHNKVLKVN